MLERWEKRKSTSELFVSRRFERPIERRWHQFNEYNCARRNLNLDHHRHEATKVLKPTFEGHTNKCTDGIANHDNGRVKTTINKARRGHDRGENKKPGLMIYDSLISLNDAVLTGDMCWIVKPRPDGKRALLSITFLQISITDRMGRQLWSCPHETARRNNTAMSHIPIGTCLDGIWSSISDQNNINSKPPIFYILDILRWNERTVEGCEFEMREFFLRSRLDEIGLINSANTAHSINDEPMEMEPVSDGVCSMCFIRGVEIASDNLVEYCSENLRIPLLHTPIIHHRDAISNIKELHFKDSNPALSYVPMSIDGVIFFHPDAYYKRGATPFVVHWRPIELSQWNGIKQRINSCVVLSIDRKSSKTPQLVTADGIGCEIAKENACQGSPDWLEKVESSVQIRSHSLLLKNDNTIVISSAEFKEAQPFNAADLLSKLVMTAQKIYQEGANGNLTEVRCTIPSLAEAIELHSRGQHRANINL